jgi:hypothetical protein
MHAYFSLYFSVVTIYMFIYLLASGTGVELRASCLLSHSASPGLLIEVGGVGGGGGGSC